MAAGRTFLCAAAGALAGIAIGGLVGFQLVPHEPSQLPADGGILDFFGAVGKFFGSLLRIVSTLIGSGVGGTLGAIFGAAASRLLPSPTNASTADPSIEPR